MAAESDSTVRPPLRGRTARGSRVAILLAGLLVAAVAAIAAAPAALAATASAEPARVVLADPTTTPSPSSGPGIGLGPGAPAGVATAPSPITTSDPSTGSDGDPSWYDIPGQIKKAIDDWFASMVSSALTPMLDLLGATLLGTPDVTVMSGVTRIWAQMALLANAFYILIVLAGAVIVTTHGTMQSRYSAKEVVPRLLVGMVAGNASLAVIALMIRLANVIAGAILGGTIDPATAGAALGHQLDTTAIGGGGIFQVLLLLGGVVMLVAIVLTYIVRVAITVMLAAGSPLALSLHAVPGADGVPRLWWRAMTGCLLIQLGQSLAFVVALDVMLDPNANVSILGLPNNNAWVDPLVFIALCWILIKIPFWVSRSMLGGAGSGIGRMAKAVIAYKTLGVLGMKKGPGGFPIRRPGTGPNRPRPPGPGGVGRGPAGRGPRPAVGKSLSGGGGITRLRPASHQQIPIPFPEGRKALEARATVRDRQLARHALARPEEPGTWLEQREERRRRLARHGIGEAPAARPGPRYRQEALFGRNPARVTAAPPAAPASPPAKPPAPKRAGSVPAKESARTSAPAASGAAKPAVAKPPPLLTANTPPAVRSRTSAAKTPQPVPPKAQPPSAFPGSVASRRTAPTPKRRKPQS